MNNSKITVVETQTGTHSLSAVQNRDGLFFVAANFKANDSEYQEDGMFPETFWNAQDAIDAAVAKIKK